ncbi:MAG: hypothetical protein RLZZ613_612 [Pseudomonadota bacterium]
MTTKAREGADAPASLPKDIDETLNALQAQHYLADRRLATALFLALQLGKPLLLEGEPGANPLSGCNATTAWTYRRPPTNGIMRANYLR